MRRPRQLSLPDSTDLSGGVKRHAPSAARNMEPIAAVLTRHLPATGQILEIASGTGQHICNYSIRFPGLKWQPSDMNPDNIATITAWAESSGATNLHPPIILDATSQGWSKQWGEQDAILLINLLHLISNPETEALLDEVNRALAPGGRFMLYGPFRRGSAFASDGDKAFDAALRAQDPLIGYKDIEMIATRLADTGLSILDRIEMPASNIMMVAQRPTSD